ncbi:Zinc finger C2H2 protein [Dictyocoela muelleri]|nr:Zinc finger C2H2 protein [Dictyocoela muelleri]
MKTKKTSNEISILKEINNHAISPYQLIIESVIRSYEQAIDEMGLSNKFANGAATNKSFFTKRKSYNEKLIWSDKKIKRSEFVKKSKIEFERFKKNEFKNDYFENDYEKFNKNEFENDYYRNINQTIENQNYKSDQPIISKTKFSKSKKNNFTKNIKPYSYYSGKKLSAVEETLNPKRKYKCKIERCRNTYTSYSGLKYHHYNGHVIDKYSEKPFKCPIVGCCKAYKNNNGLKYHLNNGHKE